MCMKGSGASLASTFDARGTGAHGTQNRTSGLCVHVGSGASLVSTFDACTMHLYAPNFRQSSRVLCVCVCVSLCRGYISHSCRQCSQSVCVCVCVCARVCVCPCAQNTYVMNATSVPFLRCSPPPAPFPPSPPPSPPLPPAPPSPPQPPQPRTQPNFPHLPPLVRL